VTDLSQTPGQQLLEVSGERRSPNPDTVAATTRPGFLSGGRRPPVNSGREAWAGTEQGLSPLRG
jgi:hypothetical protein